MEIRLHRGVIANEHIKIGRNFYEKVIFFTYLGSLSIKQNSIQDEIRPRRRWEDNIRMDLEEIGINMRHWVDLAQDRDYWRDCVNVA